MRSTESSLSDSMEMYLVSIARLRRGKQPVPLSQLAEALSVTPVSVNEMCRKLQDQDLLIYRPYKGAVLTDTGEAQANHVLRRHRLWEVFLVEKLGFEYQAAHQAACNLEHASPDPVMDRLDRYLGYPKVNPVGEPIPKADGCLPEYAEVPLTSLSPGEGGVLVCCADSCPIQEFLEDNGVRLGSHLVVTAAGKASLLVHGDGDGISLSRDLAETLIVRVEGGLPDGESSQKHTDILEEKTMKLADEKSIARLSLKDLKAGQRAVVVRVGGSGKVKRRMMDMGMVPGSEVEVVRVAPFGDPIEFSVKGYSLSLRKSEAADIEVEIID